MTEPSEVRVGQLWTNGFRTIRITSVTEHNVTFDVVSGADIENRYMSKMYLVIAYRMI